MREHLPRISIALLESVEELWRWGGGAAAATTPQARISGGATDDDSYPAPRSSLELDRRPDPEDGGHRRRPCRMVLARRHGERGVTRRCNADRSRWLSLPCRGCGATSGGVPALTVNGPQRPSRLLEPGAPRRGPNYSKHRRPRSWTRRELPVGLLVPVGLCKRPKWRHLLP